VRWLLQRAGQSLMPEAPGAIGATVPAAEPIGVSSGPRMLQSDSPMKRSTPRHALIVVGSVLCAGIGWRNVLAGRQSAVAHRRQKRADADALVLRVPHVRGEIVLDGDTDDPGWTTRPGPARTGPFRRPNGVAARPYSDARLVWGDGHLYVVLYAADEDIRSLADRGDGPEWRDDSFRLVFQRGDLEYAIEVSPEGKVADAVRRPGRPFDYAWNSGAHISHEADGTMNDSTDTDEEWVVEMAIPLESLGVRGDRGDRIGFAARRCNSPENGARVCAGWGESPAEAGEIVLE